MEFIGSKIKALIILLKIKDQEFAKSIDLSKGTLSAIVTGRNKPTYIVLYKIIDKFGVPADYFFIEKCELKIDNGKILCDKQVPTTNQKLVEENLMLKERLAILEERIQNKEEKISLLEEKLESFGVQRKARP